MSVWISALREWNGSGTWCIPKKGTDDYNEVKVIMNRMRGGSPKRKTPRKKKPKSKTPRKKKPPKNTEVIKKKKEDLKLAIRLHKEAEVNIKQEKKENDIIEENIKREKREARALVEKKETPNRKHNKNVSKWIKLRNNLDEVIELNKNSQQTFKQLNDERKQRIVSLQKEIKNL